MSFQPVRCQVSRPLKRRSNWCLCEQLALVPCWSDRDLPLLPREISQSGAIKQKGDGGIGVSEWVSGRTGTEPFKEWQRAIQELHLLVAAWFPKKHSSFSKIPRIPPSSTVCSLHRALRTLVRQLQHSPETQHKINRAVVTGRRLTAWAMARPWKTKEEKVLF